MPRFQLLFGLGIKRMRNLAIGIVMAVSSILPLQALAECSLSIKAIDCSRYDMDCEHRDYLAQKIGNISDVEISQELERKPSILGEVIKGTYFLKGPKGEHIQLQATMKCDDQPF